MNKCVIKDERSVLISAELMFAIMNFELPNAVSALYPMREVSRKAFQNRVLSNISNTFEK